VRGGEGTTPVYLDDPDGQDGLDRYDMYHATVTVIDPGTAGGPRLRIASGAGAVDNRLCYVEITSATSGASVGTTNVFAATYDYRTRRVTKTENGETTTFRYDGGVSYQEWKGGSKSAEFVRGSGMGGGIGSILYSDRLEDGAWVREYFAYNPAVGHVVATLTGDGDTLAAP